MAEVTRATAVSTTEPGRSRPAERLGRLLPLLLLGNVGMFALYAGVSGVLLPLQVAAIDPANKVANLGLVTGVSVLAAVIFTPLAGSFSDRTRGRFGRRAPWILGGALASLVGMVILGSVRTIALLFVFWALTQITMGAYQASITAVVPDRVPATRRGIASAVIGMSIPLGNAVGAILAAALAATLLTGYLTLSLLVIAVAILFTTLTKDRPVAAAETTRIRTGEWLRTLLSSLAHRDFRWVFIGRALLILGYFLVATYNLYLLQDYYRLPAGLSRDRRDRDSQPDRRGRHRGRDGRRRRAFGPVRPA
ncbi:MFS transporter [Fodinicola feengrottensis]|uniref:MFS transporter n=1 Tax=Fodinicola feengrottensis TaxID=435914 RepID=UPI00244267CC|nr:MFS transporter [Fodinicola feengrottensis]